LGQCSACVARRYRCALFTATLLGRPSLIFFIPFADQELFVQYTLFANASLRGTPPVRALFFEFPDEPELFGIDSQFLVGRDILVTPVLEPNVTSVAGTVAELPSLFYFRHSRDF